MLFQCTELRQLLGLHISYPPWKKRVVVFFFSFPLSFSLLLCALIHLFRPTVNWKERKRKKSASYVNKNEGSEAWLMPIPPVGNFSSNFILIGIFFLLRNS